MTPHGPSYEATQPHKLNHGFYKKNKHLVLGLQNSIQLSRKLAFPKDFMIQLLLLNILSKDLVYFSCMLFACFSKEVTLMA